mgnify:CR=1 FL=1
MILSLKIQNYTLIDSLEVEFQRGFSVITGETGAGKSIILGALSLLLGQRADANAVKNGEKKSIVEGVFDISGYGLCDFFKENDIEYDERECILRREISVTGKSRAFINDTPVSVSIMKLLGSRLVDIHSQHQNLLLSNTDFQLSVLDLVADNKHNLNEYKQAYSHYKKEKSRLEALIKETDECRMQEDYMRFQYTELENANLADSDEMEFLSKKLQSISHAEEIKTSIYKAYTYLSSEDTSILSQMKLVNKELEQISDYSSNVQEALERLDSMYIDLKDVSGELLNLLDSVDFDPRELEYLNERYSLLDNLLRKYRCQDISDIIELKNSLYEKISLIDDSTEIIKKQEEAVINAYNKANLLAAKLKDARQSAAKVIEREMISRLLPLGMPNVRFVTNFEEKELCDTGNVNVQFLFSANASSKLMPVAQVASGGEIARVMLALKAIIGNMTSLPTIIFDEIDTGVSGKIAESMANIMKEMGEGGRQVISITHLPQIAALGSKHYRVYKIENENTTNTHMKVLNDEERIEEIAQMISGSSVLDTARQQAKQLLTR